MATIFIGGTDWDGDLFYGSSIAAVMEELYEHYESNGDYSTYAEFAEKYFNCEEPICFIREENFNDDDCYPNKELLAATKLIDLV